MCHLRNICTRRWKELHPHGTSFEFKKYYDNLPATERQVFNLLSVYLAVLTTPLGVREAVCGNGELCYSMMFPFSSSGVYRKPRQQAGVGPSAAQRTATRSYHDAIHICLELPRINSIRFILYLSRTALS